MKRLVRTVTAERLEKLDVPVEINSLRVSSPNDDAFATGSLYREAPANGLFVSIGKLFGQRGYDAKIKSDIGLTIELRISGHSRSQELTGPRRSAEVAPGDLLLTGLKEKTDWSVKAGPQSSFEAVSLTFSRNFLQDCAAQSDIVSSWALSQLEDEALWNVRQSAELIQLASQLSASVEIRDERKNFVQHSLALRILSSAWLLHAQTSGQREQYRNTLANISSVLEFVKERLSTPLKISDLVHEFGTSATALKVLVKRETGYSVGELIRRQRMDAAAELLRSGVSISRTAELVGYTSPEALSKAVRKHFGRPPGQL
ncbi:MAG: AraC family transcriptional regulator [Pseudomonadota bacterium]